MQNSKHENKKYTELYTKFRIYKIKNINYLQNSQNM